MLRAVHGNRIEALLEAFLEQLPPADPFAPQTIVTGSRLIGKWLGREIAFARGITAGLELVSFNQFLEDVWGGDDAAKRAGIAALDRRRLGAAFASVLANEELVRSLPQVAAYLEAAPAPGDRAGPRRVQLAEHLASLTWSYALSRPDWMPALVEGRVPSELADDPSARWQARLIHAALGHAGGQRSVPAPMLPWMRRRTGLPPPKLEAPLAVFGMSFLPRAQLEALTDLAATSEVTVYILDPCEELWDDVPGRRALARPDQDDPLPLVMWGRPVRDTLAALVERTNGDLDARFGGDVAGSTARELLLADVRARRSPSASASEAGVTVLACPNPRREVEVIATEVRRLLDADPTLSAHELAVWIGGDAEYYLAQAPSAFEAVGVPCHLIDAPVDDRGRIGEAVLALLELPTSMMARRDLLRVMTHPAVLAAHPHVDAADWVRWTDRLGIAHGANADAHANTYLADVRDGSGGHFHWDQGVRRLALGAFMVGGRGDRGPAKIGGTLVAPEELRPDQQASAATYALLVRSLCADAVWLAAYSAPLARWADVLAALVDQYLAARDDDATRDLERARTLLGSLAKLDVDDRPVGFREVREHVVRMFDAARSNRGEPLASGVMIAPLAAMRALPFRVAFVAGLNEGAFPSGDQPSPLDLRRESRAGDVSPRDRDRAAFLDVLLCTREELYLSYVAVEPKSGQPLGPSSVVLELADALAPYLGSAMSSREALASITVRHPLHRYSGEVVGPAAARERWACEVRDEVRAHLRARRHPIPDEDGQLALLAHPSQVALRAALGVDDVTTVAAPVRAASRPLTVSNLRGFLEYPIQAWASAVLGLDELPDDEAEQHNDEPFHLAKKDRVTLLRDVFAAHLREGRELEAIYREVIAARQLSGQFPVGVFAEAARALDLEVLTAWRDTLGSLAEWFATTTGAPRAGAAKRFGFGRAFAAGAELLPAIELALPGGRTVRLLGQTEVLVRIDQHRFASVVPLVKRIERRTHYHLRGAFDHLLLAAAGISNAGHVHWLINHLQRPTNIHHEPWSQAEALAFLGELAAELLDQSHGYLLPFEVLARALAGRPTPVRWGDPTGGLGYGPIDRKDGLAMPADAIEMANRRLRPLVERMRGDHGFEMAVTGPRPTTVTPRPPPPPQPPQPSPPPSRDSRPQLTIIKGGRP